jgi:hypothetical protein
LPDLPRTPGNPGEPSDEGENQCQSNRVQHLAWPPTLFAAASRPRDTVLSHRTPAPDPLSRHCREGDDTRFLLSCKSRPQASSPWARDRWSALGYRLVARRRSAGAHETPEPLVLEDRSW